jgi:DNA-binding NarL/FixJ family response regulator
VTPPTARDRDYGTSRQGRYCDGRGYVWVGPPSHLSPHGSKQAKQPIEVVLVCRPQLLRLGLERLLRKGARLEVSSHASLPHRTVPVDVAVVCDRDAKDAARLCGEALEVCAVALVVVLDQPQPELMLDCLGAGAGGFVSEQDDPNELLEAVGAVARGEYHLARGPLTALLDWHRAERRTRSERSRARDRDLLELLARGRTTGEIAERLGIAPKTVRNRTSLLYRRLGVRSRAQAALVAEERGLLD